MINESEKIMAFLYGIVCFLLFCFFSAESMDSQLKSTDELIPLIVPEVPRIAPLTWLIMQWILNNEGVINQCFSDHNYFPKKEDLKEVINKSEKQLLKGLLKDDNDSEKRLDFIFAKSVELFLARFLKITEKRFPDVTEWIYMKTVYKCLQHGITKQEDNNIHFQRNIYKENDRIDYNEDVFCLDRKSKEEFNWTLSRFYQEEQFNLADRLVNEKDEAQHIAPMTRFPETGKFRIHLLLYKDLIEYVSKGVFIAQLSSKYLSQLKYNNSKLNEIPDWIGKLEGLRVLDLSCNNLTSIPDDIVCLKLLRAVSFFDNQIKEIPKTINRFEILEIFNISKNDLQSVPDELFKLPDYCSINITKNDALKIERNRLPINNKPEIIRDHSQIQSIEGNECLPS